LIILIILRLSKKLKAATASKPELIDRIENTTLNDQGILEILTEFEKLD